MSIAEFAKSLFESVSVGVKDNIVTVDGLPSDFIERDLYRIWRQSRIADNMFYSKGKNRVTFDRFFLPDFYYALQRILTGKYMRCNRRVVEQLIFEIEDHTWLGNLNKVFPSILNKSKLSNLTWTPEPHQATFFDVFDQQVQRMDLNGYLLSAAPGTGKTFTSMALNEMLEADLIIYVVPNNSVDDVWKKTHKNVLKNSDGTYWSSHDGVGPDTGKRIFIFHYETLEQALNFFKSNEAWLRAHKRVTVTLDECHNFNSLTSLRTELFIELCKFLKPLNILWMSGTPVKALGSEVIPLLMTIDKYFTKEIVERFKKIFGMSSTAGLDILAHRLGLVSHKIAKDQVLTHKVLEFRVDVKLPNGSDYTLDTIRKRMAEYIEERMAYYQKNMASYLQWYFDGLKAYEKVMPSSEKKDYALYQKYAKEIHEGYDPILHKNEVVFCNKFEKRSIIPTLTGVTKERFVSARSVYKYYHLKVQGEALGRILGRARTLCNIDVALNIKDAVMTDLQTNERSYTNLPDIINSAIKKTLLYTDFVEVVDSVCAQLEGQGYKTLKVYGETNKDLPSILKTFAEKPKYNPLAATYKSLSTAVPMIMANTIVMLNSPYREHDRVQTVSRVDRMGQDEDVHIYTVYLDTGKEPNISTRSKDIMDWSREMVEAIMGRPAAAVDEDMKIAMEDFDDEDIPLDVPAVKSHPRNLVNTNKSAWVNW